VSDVLGIKERFTRKQTKWWKRKSSELNLDWEALPRCHARVVIASPHYSDSHFACEITVGVEEILPWAEDHAEKCWSSDSEQQAAKKAMPLWFRNADLSCDEPSYLSPNMHKVIGHYVHNFTGKESAQVICLECGSIVRDIKEDKYNEVSHYSRLIWTSEWHCENGHQLYYQEYDVHIHRRC